MVRRVLLIALSFTAVSAAQAEQVYKWTDAKGVTHFTDSPPPKDVSKDKVTRLEVAKDQPSSSQSSTNTNSSMPTSSAQESPGSAAEVNPAQQLADACTKARSQVELLQSNHQVVMERNGKNEQLDDTAKKAELVKAQERVAAYCKQ